MTFKGKTIICKTRAIISADSTKSCNVYYISTVATHKNGNPRKECFMFDVLTKNVDMKNINAIPIDINDLIDVYNKTNVTFEVFFDEHEPKANNKMKKRRKDGTSSDLSTIDVYELLEHFIKEKTKLDAEANFIVDELPILIDGHYTFLILFLSFSNRNEAVKF